MALPPSSIRILDCLSLVSQDCIGAVRTFQGYRVVNKWAQPTERSALVPFQLNEPSEKAHTYQSNSAKTPSKPAAAGPNKLERY